MVCVPIITVEMFSFCPHPHLLSFVFLTIAITTHVRYLIVLLICVYLMIRNVLFLFIFVFSICISSFEKCLICLGSFLFLVLIISVPYIATFEICALQIFYTLCRLPFYFTVPFAMQKFSL